MCRMIVRVRGTDGNHFNKLSDDPSSGVGRQGHDSLDGFPKDAAKH